VITVRQIDSGQTVLFGVALANGDLLWNSLGLTVEFNGVNYTLPFVSAAPLGNFIVADFAQWPTFAWQGFKAPTPASPPLLTIILGVAR
jgi:hypothetical protein